MKACREMRPLLEWLAADELEGALRQRAEAHLDECPDCRRELAAWRSLLGAAALPDADVEAEIRAVDWNALAEGIAARAERGGRPAPGAAGRRFFALRPLAAAAAVVVIAGLAALVWFQPRRGPLPAAAGDDRAAAVAHLQSGLAREEVLSYLRQSQLVFTDLLKDCPSEEMAPMELRLYSRKAKELLLRKKYVEQSLPPVEWLKVRQVSERIDWLNYEILQLEERRLCSQIHRLQRLLEDENLLLKIRLLERDLSSRPTIEV